MNAQVQLQLWPEMKEIEEGPAKGSASPVEMARPVLDEAEKWVLAAYLRGEARAIGERAPRPTTDAQLSFSFPS